MAATGPPPEQAVQIGRNNIKAARGILTGMPGGLYIVECRAFWPVFYCFFLSRVCLVGLLGAAALAGALVDMLRRAALASGSPFLAAS